jgi:hypothetical protein
MEIWVRRCVFIVLREGSLTNEWLQLVLSAATTSENARGPTVTRIDVGGNDCRCTMLVARVRCGTEEGGSGRRSVRPRRFPSS